MIPRRPPRANRIPGAIRLPPTVARLLRFVAQRGPARQDGALDALSLVLRRLGVLCFTRHTHVIVQAPKIVLAPGARPGPAGGGAPGPAGSPAPPEPVSSSRVERLAWHWATRTTLVRTRELERVRSERHASRLERIVLQAQAAKAVPSARIESRASFPRLLPATRTRADEPAPATRRESDRAAPPPPPTAAPASWASPGPRNGGAPAPLPAQELARVTDHVMLQIGQRARSWRERHGRI